MSAPHDCLRSASFSVGDTSGDGLTLSGHAAVFNQTTRIDSWEGKFDERIAPGAFTRSLAAQTPVLMFEHGHHPLVGSMPIGKLTAAREDSQGLYVEARLHDNWLTEPVRDAISSRAVTGMSFRFVVADGGETWTSRTGDVSLRTITDATVPELGPVVFPAYAGTDVAVRAVMERFDLAHRATDDHAAMADALDQLVNQILNTADEREALNLCRAAERLADALEVALI